jgi:hypothetical protein
VAMHRLGLLALLLIWACVSQAQELEPRAYSPSPVGANFVVIAMSQSTGGVLFDPALPFTDVDAKLNASALAYGRTFGLLDRSASMTLAAPYVWGRASGNVGTQTREIHRSGLADARLRLAVNLIGGPAMTPAEFAQRKPQTTLGMSMTVVPPTGQYDPAKLINIGSNRWALKPEIGISHPVGRWFMEAYAGVWLFTDNDNFFGGQHREQKPITSLQWHVSYTFKPRMWLALNTTYYNGGSTTVDDIHKADRQENSRVGLTFSLPAGARQSLKFSWSDGASTRIGSDFMTYGVAWQYTWFD